MKIINPQRSSLKAKAPRYIIIKLLKMSDQEKILKAARGKKSKLNNIEKK